MHLGTLSIDLPCGRGGIGRCTFSMERRSPFQSLIFGSLLNAPSDKKVTFSQNCQKLKFCWCSWRIQPIWKISVSVKLFIFPIFEGKNIYKILETTTLQCIFCVFLQIKPSKFPVFHSFSTSPWRDLCYSFKDTEEGYRNRKIINDMYDDFWIHKLPMSSLFFTTKHLPGFVSRHHSNSSRHFFQPLRRTNWFTNISARQWPASSDQSWAVFIWGSKILPTMAPQNLPF